LKLRFALLRLGLAASRRKKLGSARPARILWGLPPGFVSLRPKALGILFVPRGFVSLRRTALGVLFVPRGFVSLRRTALGIASSIPTRTTS